MVERANSWAALLGVDKRVQFVSTNANVSLAGLLASYPGPLAEVYIQFPDPHFKRRHRKRAIFQPLLVAAVAERLQPGGACQLLRGTAALHHHRCTASLRCITTAALHRCDASPPPSASLPPLLCALRPLPPPHHHPMLPL